MASPLLGARSRILGAECLDDGQTASIARDRTAVDGRRARLPLRPTSAAAIQRPAGGDLPARDPDGHDPGQHLLQGPGKPLHPRQPLHRRPSRASRPRATRSERPTSTSSRPSTPRRRSATSRRSFAAASPWSASKRKRRCPTAAFAGCPRPRCRFAIRPARSSAPSGSRATSPTRSASRSSSSDRRSTTRLTQLPNRWLFLNRLEHVFRRAERLEGQRFLSR